jgi:hypothetical protein
VVGKNPLNLYNNYDEGGVGVGASKEGSGKKIEGKRVYVPHNPGKLQKDRNELNFGSNVRFGEEPSYQANYGQVKGAELKNNLGRNIIVKRSSINGKLKEVIANDQLASGPADPTDINQNQSTPVESDERKGKIISRKIHVEKKPFGSHHNLLSKKQRQDFRDSYKNPFGTEDEDPHKDYSDNEIIIAEKKIKHLEARLRTKDETKNAKISKKNNNFFAADPTPNPDLPKLKKFDPEIAELFSDDDILTSQHSDTNEEFAELLKHYQNALEINEDPSNPSDPNTYDFIGTNTKDHFYDISEPFNQCIEENPTEEDLNSKNTLGKFFFMQK